MPIKQLFPDTPYVVPPAPVAQHKMVPEPLAEPAPPEEPGLLRKLLGMGLRGGAGLVGAEGGATGAVAGGAGEFLAELAEGSYKDLPDAIKRVGTEAAIGAVPLGGLVKYGRPVASAVRGAAYGAAAPLVRHDVEEASTPSDLITNIPRIASEHAGEIATGAGIGGLTSGVLAHFLGLGKPPQESGVLHGNEAFQDAGARPPVAVDRPGPAPNVPDVQGGIVPGTESGRVQKIMAREAKAAGKLPANTGGRLVPPSGGPKNLETALKDLLQPTSGSVEKVTLPPGPDITDMGKEGAFTSSGRPGVDAARYDELNRQPLAWSPDMVDNTEGSTLPNGPGTPHITNGKTEAEIRDLQRQAMARHEAANAPQAGQEFWRAIQNPNRMLPAAGDVTEEARVIDAPRRPTTGTSMTQGNVLRPDQDPEALRQQWIQGLFGPDARLEGGNPYAMVPGDDELARSLRQRAHIDRNMANKYKGASPEVPVQGPIENSQSLSKAAAKAKGEKGAISNDMLVRLGLGATGAIAGAATDPLNDPVASTIAGGAAGALAPSLLNVPNLGIKSAKDLAQTASNAQRFNLLGSLKNLPANAIAAPLGHTFFEGLERKLAGDPTGDAILKSVSQLTPQHYMDALKESGDVIEGRAGETSNSLLSAPGRAINAGDKMAQKALSDTGVVGTEDARRITATNEPQSKWGQKLREFAKSSLLGQLMMPFPRTFINLFEQGSLRTPGLRQVMQTLEAAPDVPNNTKLALMQQLLGAGVGTASGVLGSQLSPEQARLVRPYVSNLAGLYSLPANIGFGVGQALQKSNNPNASAGFGGALQEFEQSMPMSQGLDLSPAGVSRRLVPGGVSDIAQLMDKNVTRKTTKVSDNAFQAYLDSIKARIPGLREQLPATRPSVKRPHVVRPGQ